MTIEKLKTPESKELKELKNLKKEVLHNAKPLEGKDVMKSPQYEDFVNLVDQIKGEITNDQKETFKGIMLSFKNEKERISFMDSLNSNQSKINKVSEKIKEKDEEIEELRKELLSARGNKIDEYRVLRKNAIKERDKIYLEFNELRKYIIGFQNCINSILPENIKKIDILKIEGNKIIVYNKNIGRTNLTIGFDQDFKMTTISRSIKKDFENTNEKIEKIKKDGDIENKKVRILNMKQKIELEDKKTTGKDYGQIDTRNENISILTEQITKDETEIQNLENGKQDVVYIIFPEEMTVKEYEAKTGKKLY